MRFHFHIWKKQGEKDLYSYDPIRTWHKYPVRVLVRTCLICGEEQGKSDVWYETKWRPIFGKENEATIQPK